MLLPAAAQDQNPCAACHQEQTADFQTHKHASRGLQCGVCHGPSEKHRGSVGNVPPDRVAAPEEVAALCGNCHAQERKHFESSGHGRVYTEKKNVRTANCSTCHGHHALRAWTAQTAQCAKCHTSIPDACKGTPANAQARVACMGCHAAHTLMVSGRR